MSEFSRPKRRQILPPEFDEKLGSRKHHHSPFLDEKHRDPHSQETGGLKYNVKRHIEKYRQFIHFQHQNFHSSSAINILSTGSHRIFHVQEDSVTWHAAPHRVSRMTSCQLPSLADDGFFLGGKQTCHRNARHTHTYIYIHVYIYMDYMALFQHASIFFPWIWCCVTGSFQFQGVGHRSAPFSEKFDYQV